MIGALETGFVCGEKMGDPLSSSSSLSSGNSPSSLQGPNSLVYVVTRWQDQEPKGFCGTACHHSSRASAAPPETSCRTSWPHNCRDSVHIERSLQRAPWLPRHGQYPSPIFLKGAAVSIDAYKGEGVPTARGKDGNIRCIATFGIQSEPKAGSPGVGLRAVIMNPTLANNLVQVNKYGLVRARCHILCRPLSI